MPIKLMIPRWSVLAVGLAITIAAVLAGAVAFGPRPPAPLPSVAAALKHLDLDGLPPISRYTARDGAMLAYRAYPGDGPHVALLLHGSAGQSSGLNAMARAINRAGATVYALDVRGHGESGRRGDIDYIGQLEDDVADFIHCLRPARTAMVYTLAGFSAGGAFTLRVAGGRYGNLFDRYIAIAPALVVPNGVARPSNDPWATISLPRIAGLMVLNGVGIHRFDSLDVVQYAAPHDDPFFTRAYSYRLAMNFSPGLAYLSALRRVKKPITVIAGADDDQFYADRYAALLKPAKPDIAIEIVPGVGHAGATGAPAMLKEVVRVFRTMPVQDPAGRDPAN